MSSTQRVTPLSRYSPTAGLLELARLFQTHPPVRTELVLYPREEVRGMGSEVHAKSSWYRNPRYHTARDTPETLDYARMAKVVEGVAAAVSEIPR